LIPKDERFGSSDAHGNPKADRVCGTRIGDSSRAAVSCIVWLRLGLNKLHNSLDLFKSLHKASSVESAEQPHEEKDISTIH
jgi:hypothetical protein